MIVVSAAFPGHGEKLEFSRTSDLLRWLVARTASITSGRIPLDRWLGPRPEVDPAGFRSALQRVNSALVRWQLSEEQFAKVLHLQERYRSYCCAVTTIRLRTRQARGDG